MKIGFTGTRNGLTDAQRATLGTVLVYDLLPGGDTIGQFHHGSCRGADVEAARLVRYILGGRTAIISHPGPDRDTNREDSGVDDEVRPPKTHFARNRDIVNETDVLIACPLKQEPITKNTPGGTAYTINFARKKGKRIVIIWPDGSLAEEVAR